MSITVSVMYPNGGSKFDMDYYLGTHGPLVRDKWDSKGLKSLKVIKGLARPPTGTRLLPIRSLSVCAVGCVVRRSTLPPRSKSRLPRTMRVGRMIRVPRNACSPSNSLLDCR
jgi:hypothetical protein